MKYYDIFYTDRKKTKIGRDFIHLAFLLNGPNYFLSKLKNIKNQIFHPRLDRRALALFLLYNMHSMQCISRVWPRLKVREKEGPVYDSA